MKTPLSSIAFAPFTPFALLALAALSFSGSAPAQTVASVAGRTVTLSAGTNAGVATGMTGKLCGRQVAGGREGEYCPARFRVTLVTSATATLEITEGDAGGVARGMTARFDQRLVAGPRPTPTPRVRSAAELKAEADRLYDAKDYERAAERYRELATRHPNDPNADYARSLADAASQKAAEVRAKADEERRRAEGRREADRLAMEARRMLDAGLWQEARDRAVQALAADPSNAAAATAKREAESRLGPARELTDTRSGVKFVLIPAGSFTMGCTAGDGECDADERPAHRVTLTRPYYVAETETTVGQYGAYARATGASRPASPGFAQGEDHPVVNVSWSDAEAFCRFAGGRLPTEAEWENAARGGREGNKYPWGNSISHDDANYGKDQCCGGATGGRDQWMNTSPAKSFSANGFGLYDMAGNVWEWVGDWYDGSYYGRSPSADPTGPSAGQRRVLRGGSWDVFPRYLRVSYRYRDSPDGRSDVVGFRCARDANP